MITFLSFLMLNVKYELHTWQFTREGQVNKLPVFVECHFIFSSLVEEEGYINSRLSELLKYLENTEWQVHSVDLKEYSENSIIFHHHRK